MIRSSAAVALLLLGACSGAVNETAATTTYNARYIGLAYLQGAAPTATPLVQPLAVSATFSQIASTVTGTITLATQASRPDTILTAGVTGHTTSTGLDLTVVQPLGCATRLSGPLALGTDGSSLSGTLIGSDCRASGTDNMSLNLMLSRE